MPTVTHPVVAVIGNPNTGKTTLFNRLAGMRQRVGNYPGVTVETKKGSFRLGETVIDVIDLPGAYSLAPRSPDEMVAVDVALGLQPREHKPDLIVTVVDASNLERNLYLTTQVMELGLPVIVALNMTDIARSRGLRIDPDALAERLGVPVVPMQANKGIGVEQLKQAIGRVLREPHIPEGPDFPAAVEAEVARLRERLGSDTPDFLLRRLLFDVGGYVEQEFVGRYGAELRNALAEARERLRQAGCPVPAVEARVRYDWIRNVISGCLERPAQRPTTWTDRIDSILTHKLWGSLVFVAVMFVVFQSIFAWAEPLTGLIEEGQGWLEGVVGGWFDPGPLRSLIVRGVIGGVGAVVIFLPQIMILFAFIAVLEDCGYMARAAYLMDKIMSRCGLSGKSFIPMLSSIACAVPGIMAARVIEDRRDRFATIIVAPLMSCSARLPVYTLLIGAFLSTRAGYPTWVAGLTLFAMYMIGLIVAPLVAWIAKRTVLRGPTPVFVMEIPPYKLPSLTLVARRVFDAGWMFIRRAGTIILASMILVWALLYFTVGERSGAEYDRKIAELQSQIEDSAVEDERETAALQQAVNDLYKQWSSESLLGWMGQAIEPAVRPLGWDWRIGMAALASFPAREVFVGTLGIIYDRGEGDAGDEEYQRDLAATLREQTWDHDPSRKVFTVPTALSVMVFFALCCQCASTLAVIKRETNSWRWPVLTFVYMTALAYVAALITYQVASLIIG